MGTPRGVNPKGTCRWCNQTVLWGVSQDRREKGEKEYEEALTEFHVKTKEHEVAVAEATAAGRYPPRMYTYSPRRSSFLPNDSWYHKEDGELKCKEENLPEEEDPSNAFRSGWQRAHPKEFCYETTNSGDICNKTVADRNLCGIHIKPVLEREKAYEASALNREIDEWRRYEQEQLRLAREAEQKKLTDQVSDLNYKIFYDEIRINANHFWEWLEKKGVIQRDHSGD